MEKLHLHFCLYQHDQNKEYFIQGHGKKEKLQTYAADPEAFAAHQKINPALALVPQSHQYMITHYIEDIKLPHSKISRLSVVTPAANADDIFPDLVSMHIHVPAQNQKKTLKKALAAAPTPHPLVLTYLGVGARQARPEANTPAQLDVAAGAALVVLPPLATAQAIVFHHPEIGSVNLSTTGTLFCKYMQDQNNFDHLVNYISNNPDTSSNPWYKKSYAIKVHPVTLQQSPMTPDDTRTYADGNPINWPTDKTTGQKVIPQYQLSDEESGASDGGVMAAAKTAVFSVLKQTMPLSGSGNLEGLVKQPKAMTIAADGRIIILEQGNNRFQSLDIKGNPVAAFKGPLTTTLPALLVTDLNNGNASADLLKAYQTQVPAAYLRQPMFIEYDNTPVDDLNNGIVDDTLMQFFKDNGIILSTTPDDVAAVVNVSGTSWLVTDQSSNVTYDIRWNDAMYELSVYNGANLQIDVVTPGLECKVADLVNSLTFEIKPGTASTGPLQVQQLISTATLRTQAGNTIEYLDIATEDKGYIYELYFENEGTSASQYKLDIYNPDGTVQLNHPLTDLAAAKMSVDQWRTLWTLNYETFLGPNNRTEPTVSGWIPSTPDGPSGN